MSEASAILVLAHRDFAKLLRDRQRIIADFSFPLIFIGILGTTLRAGFGERAGINLLHFVFTGVLAQTVWQSSAMGLISLIANLPLLDRAWKDPRRVARHASAGARDHRLRLHPAGAALGGSAPAHGRGG